MVRFPGIWNKSGLGNPTSKPGSPLAAGGAALIVAACAILTAPLWAAPDHVIDGYNLVLTLEVQLLVDGIAILVAGVGMVVYALGRRWSKQARRVVAAAE